MAAGYASDETALLVVDPYNDFLSEGGKVWPRAKETAERVHLHDHMRQILAATRSCGIRTIIVPHHRTVPGDYTTWRYLTPTQQNIVKRQTFARGSWGGEFHPDFAPVAGDLVAQEHWASSGFANTDLNLLLKQHGIAKIVLIGMKVNTCIDTTARFGQELGYHVTLIKDATAGFDWAEMQATFEINAPAYAHAILTTDDFIAALPAPAAGKAPSPVG
jgi:nicotinamidase-related amidase